MVSCIRELTYCPKNIFVSGESRGGNEADRDVPTLLCGNASKECVFDSMCLLYRPPLAQQGQWPSRNHHVGALR